MEVTRQFLATNNKVINRGDSFRRRDPAPRDQRASPRRAEHSGGAGAGQAAPQIHVAGEAGPARHVSGPHVDKCFRVVFLGGREVGKSSIVDQFMSSEHADVYEDTEEEDDSRHTRERSVRTSWPIFLTLLSACVNVLFVLRLLTVDVNNVLTQLSLVEVTLDSASSLDTLDTVTDEYNPDCFVLVYAVDDRESFEVARATLRQLADTSHLAGKRCILVGAKADLVRSRVVSTGDGCAVAMETGDS